MATEAAFPGADHHAGGGDRHPSRLLVCTVAQLAGADIGLRIRDAASGLFGPPSGETSRDWAMQVEARRNGVCGRCATTGMIENGGEEMSPVPLSVP